MSSLFGPFELERLLGRGGMAEAFVAHRTDDPEQRSVVLKRIRPDLAHQEEYLRRFVLEAQVASRLRHPNLVRFVEFGRVGECHYICMEFVRGHSLHRLMEPLFKTKKPPSLPAALHIGVGVFDGLAAMHAVRDEHGEPRPMLHRDVTPANVIIAEDGRPVIIDFGIAKDVLGPAITIPGRVIGTARYMAPEHRRAEFIDARADVFSASAILFELLTARHPWPALDSMRELLRTTFDPPEITPALKAHIPGDVEPILLKGLACDPDDRYPDAQAMASALRATDSYASTGSLGGRAVLHWLADQRIDPDDSLDEPVIDTAHQEGVAWTPEGVLSTRPAPSDRSTLEGGGVPTSGTSRAVLSIPPLPPRRDAALGGADALLTPARGLSVWFLRLLLLGGLLLLAAVCIAILFTR